MRCLPRNGGLGKGVAQARQRSSYKLELMEKDTEQPPPWIAAAEPSMSMDVSCCVFSSPEDERGRLAQPVVPCSVLLLQLSPHGHWVVVVSVLLSDPGGEKCPPPKLGSKRVGKAKWLRLSAPGERTEWAVGELNKPKKKPTRTC